MEALGLATRGQGERILLEKFPAWHQWAGAVTPLHHNGQQQFE